MPHSPRYSRPSWIVLFSSLVLLAVACAQGNDATSTPTAPVSTQEPTDPGPVATTTPDKPKTPEDPDTALPPQVYSVSPDKATVGAVGPSVIVTGENFVPRSILQLDGAPLATSFISATELRATVPTSKLSAVGTLRLSVGTSPPGGGASKEVTFAVENPTAGLTTLAPMSVLAGTGTTSLHVTGNGFVPGAKVVFGATDLVTTYVGMSDLDATIPSNLLLGSGSIPVKVVNPPPGGGESSPIAFTIANPNASLQAISPMSAFVGAGPITLVVNGGGFISTSTVLFNGTNLSTSYVSSSQVTATVPAALLVNPGDFPVAVNNPPPGGGVTSPLTFRVQYPTPVTQSINPASGIAGSAPIEITITGTNLYPASQVTFSGAASATTYVDSTHIKATLTAAQLANGDTILVRVVNPAPGGGTSSAQSFTVNNPAPTIASLNPGSVTSGSADKTITLTGSGYLGASTVTSNGVPVLTTFISNTQLTAIVPSSQLINPGSVAIVVKNPTPGGGSSAVKMLSVGCDTSGVDVALGPVGTTTTLFANWAAAPNKSRFSDSGSCASTVIDPNNLQPARFWVVQNTAGAPVTLSAWADCTASGKQDDAYLTFYRRPTVPATDQERLACNGTIAEGIDGPAGMSSPEPGASMWCPGLTKSNGGGLVLAACEKVVVHAQPYSNISTTYPPPPSLKVKAE